ncbi:hypothetical protein TQ33_1015 [Kangiella geojedonensis]|uniref:DUF1315 domain-containing protein n=2 Tax=Kangiella geojedonensis TaxID=914150 RepID=A0A0F6TQ85_9GAMM|nr:hypothetical protein TQ33_1015 [Kangiella geojedonensis]
MDFSQLIKTLTPDMIERFTVAVETGKWPDGAVLTEQQKETCIQAIMLYKARHSEDDSEPFTVTKTGDLVTGKKVRDEFPGKSANESESKDTFIVDPSMIIPGKDTH